MLILVARFWHSLELENVIRWTKYTIIVHGVLALVFLVGMLFYHPDSELLRRVSGPYRWAYISLILLNVFLPLWVALKPKRNNNLWTLLFISGLMNAGAIFESFVIMITSLHRDFGTFIPIGTLRPIVKGAVVAASLLSVNYLSKTKWFNAQHSIAKSTGLFLLSLLPFVILFFIGDWLTSLYGFDPPYVWFYAGLILKFSALTFGFFILLFAIDHLLFKLR